ncbi:MAG TPA: tyrosine-type recombinase/integrase [Terriglobales bacterium]|nr:tyrosine-type recombinase/integrase [Terriglobales bacterium]
MRGKITKRTVEDLRTRIGEDVLWDTDVKGFGVRKRSTDVCVYIFRYRPAPGGRSAPQRTLTIGRHGSPWSPDSARSEALRILGSVKAGADPAASKNAFRQGPTVGDLAVRFIAEHAQPKRKKRTALEYQRLIDIHIVPALGSRKVLDVTRRDIAVLHHKLSATPYQANRILAVLRKMFNLAERWGMRPDDSNPCKHIDKYREQSRERMLSNEEWRRLGEAMREYSGAPYPLTAIKLLMLTGARLSEVLQLKWEWVNLGRCEARLPDSKTGPKTIHLPLPAVDMLGSLVRVDGCPFVFPGSKPGSSLVNLQKPWRRLREKANLRDVRLHDLRHAFASVAVEKGFSLPIVGKMLGHSQPATTARYAHLANASVKAAAEQIASHISSVIEAPA